MINSFKEKMLGKNEMYLGKKKVEIKKLTPASWKKLFSILDNLPGLIIQIATAPKKDFYMMLIQAVDMSIDEITTAVSILTDIDEDYITNHVGLDELVEFITRTVKINRLDTTIKNLKSLLPKKQ